MPEYKDLQAMIFQNADARQYYNELPKYIREMLNERGDDLNTFDSLQRYAETLLIGD